MKTSLESAEVAPIVTAKIEKYFNNAAIEAQTSQPNEVRLISTLKTAYVIFPSVEAAKRVLYSLEGTATINGAKIGMDFYQMNLMKNKGNSTDANLIQDWICDKVPYHPSSAD